MDNNNNHNDDDDGDGDDADDRHLAEAQPTVSTYLRLNKNQLGNYTLPIKCP